MSGKVIVSFADPVIKDFDVRFQAEEEAFFEDVQFVIAFRLQIINKQLISLYLHIQII